MRGLMGMMATNVDLEHRRRLLIVLLAIVMEKLVSQYGALSRVGSTTGELRPEDALQPGDRFG